MSRWILLTIGLLALLVSACSGDFTSTSFTPTGYAGAPLGDAGAPGEAGDAPVATAGQAEAAGAAGGMVAGSAGAVAAGGSAPIPPGCEHAIMTPDGYLQLQKDPCYRTQMPFQKVLCGGSGEQWLARTLIVNGEAAKCGQEGGFAPPAADGYTYFEISGGDLTYPAWLYWVDPTAIQLPVACEDMPDEISGGNATLHKGTRCYRTTEVFEKIQCNGYGWETRVITVNGYLAQCDQVKGFAPQIKGYTYLEITEATGVASVDWK